MENITISADSLEKFLTSGCQLAQIMLNSDLPEDSKQKAQDFLSYLAFRSNFLSFMDLAVNRDFWARIKKISECELSALPNPETLAVSRRLIEDAITTLKYLIAAEKGRSDDSKCLSADEMSTLENLLNSFLAI